MIERPKRHSVGKIGIDANDFLARIKKPASASKTKAKADTYYPADEILEGDLVYHSKFGEGDVIGVKEDRGDLLITIDFKNSGVRRLLGSMAKLMKIDG